MHTYICFVSYEMVTLLYSVIVKYV